MVDDHYIYWSSIQLYKYSGWYLSSVIWPSIGYSYKISTNIIHIKDILYPIRISKDNISFIMVYIKYPYNPVNGYDQLCIY